MRDPHVATGDRLHALRARGAVELHQAERVAEVGQRERRHAVVRCRRDRVVEAYRAVDDRELAVQPQVDEGGIEHGLLRRC
jgi:hypothetical protein